jgi:hypothetical protein
VVYIELGHLQADDKLDRAKRLLAIVRKRI